LARWLHLNPKLLIVDEPTHGVDVGAKFEIYELLKKMALTSTSILLISSELPEVLALADRILVVYHGKIVGELSRSEATEGRILALASGEESDK
jgi:ABC-type sugar transport system ATPase subunit